MNDRFWELYGFVLGITAIGVGVGIMIAVWWANQ